MGYMHINNLYKDQTVLMFKELYALEKLHGTSAHLYYDKNQHIKFVDPGNASQFRATVKNTPECVVSMFSGGASIVSFEQLVNMQDFADACAAMNAESVLVHGELYGGSQQKQAYRYGPKLKFGVFDVCINGTWLTVPDAADVAKKLGLEFVYYEKIPGTVEACDKARDMFSTQAYRNGMGMDKFMEGVVLRPTVEMTDNRGNRVMAKHKRPEERETATDRKVEDPKKLAVLSNATEIANEWVTETRLDHVLDKIPGAGLRETGQVLKAMLEDVFREAGLEIIDTKEARDAITTKTRLMFHARVKKV